MIESLFASTNYQATKVMLDAASLRHRVMAGNLANVNTPGYQRMDLAPDFEVKFQELLRSGDRAGMQRLSEPKVLPEEGLKAVHENGNNVSMDRELMLINQNALEYQTMSQFVSSSLSRLKMAITGRSQ